MLGTLTCTVGCRGSCLQKTVSSHFKILKRYISYLSLFCVVIDSQISEVAKMLYQQGVTELIHSSPSEQVAYLLVERASLPETSEDCNNGTGDGNTAGLLGTEAQALNSNADQVRGRSLSSSIGMPYTYIDLRAKYLFHDSVI